MKTFYNKAIYNLYVMSLIPWSFQEMLVFLCRVVIKNGVSLGKYSIHCTWTLRRSILYSEVCFRSFPIKLFSKKKLMDVNYFCRKTHFHIFGRVLNVPLLLILFEKKRFLIKMKSKSVVCYSCVNSQTSFIEFKILNMQLLC